MLEKVSKAGVLMPIVEVDKEGICDSVSGDESEEKLVSVEICSVAKVDKPVSDIEDDVSDSKIVVSNIVAVDTDVKKVLGADVSEADEDIDGSIFELKAVVNGNLGVETDG